MQQKADILPNGGFRQRLSFCTECGPELQDFCFGELVNDLEAVRKIHAQCLRTEKFNGEFCSKLFIACDQDFEELFDADAL